MVRGVVRTEYGDFSAGERVELYSPSLRQQYTAVSDDLGRIVFEEIEPSSDYRVSVSPDGRLEKYRRRDVKLDAGNTDLDIVLEVLQTGTLRGRVVDPWGRPVPHFAVWAWSRSGSEGMRSTRSDSVGLFQVPDFPEGPFEVSTRGIMWRVEGLSFEPGSNDLATLVVDDGSERLTGRIIDHHGQPVGGATVVLDWEHFEDGVRSTVQRQALTDSSGGFSMEGLAYGEHELVVSSTDGTAVKRSVIVGGVPAEMVLYLTGEPVR